MTRLIEAHDPYRATPSPWAHTHVADESSSAEVGRWSYDEPRGPSLVVVCPSVCGDGVEGTLETAFGCETIKI